MPNVEASGKNVEEAIENALEELGAERDDVEVEVLSEGRHGVLGVGAEDARVRVWTIGDPPDDVSRETTAAAGEESEAEDGEGEPEEDEAELAAQMLDHLLQLMGIEADVSIRDAETPGDGLGMATAVLDVEGDDLGILIGRRGETLTALQYLLNLMAGRQFGEHTFFTVDVEGYRRRRERTLTGLARRTADMVKRTGRPSSLEPMPANERRIIHIALSEDRQVMTESEGEGDERAITILLRK